MNKKFVVGSTVVAVAAIGLYLWSYEATPTKSSSLTETILAELSTPTYPDHTSSINAPNEMPDIGKDHLKSGTSRHPKPEENVETSNDPEVADPGDEVYEAEQVEDPLFPPTVLGQVLTENLMLTEGLGPDAENAYQSSLERLRQEPQDAVALLTKAYEKLAENYYLDRWKLVDTLGAIESPESLDVLAKIARSQVPKEKYPGMHGFSSKSEELMIRHAAIWGIEQLVKGGDTEAQATLRALTKVVEPNVRERVVLAYLRTGTNRSQRKAELKTELQTSDHWMLDLGELSDARLAGAVEVPEPTKGVDAKVDPESIEPTHEESMPPAGVLP